MVLYAAELEFEDHRIEMSDWPAIKPNTPSGQLPILDVITDSGETRQMDESFAIARWLARKHQMMGSNDDEYYEIERAFSQVEVTAPGLSKDKFPIFERHRETVLKKHAKLAAYMESRPTTDL
ncbi:prostaglandin-H2 D-isomerase / glutathione transferase [Paragonimus westermani]|uniref:glutathione transferase n=1 Tax=Paragonimus westermani TaxID=34504 RepID=A0A5J4NRV1_9TREM|nr:prostaglandin-H2 D-isomerase / glutathione transferase [Paragonimus westermani]